MATTDTYLMWLIWKVSDLQKQLSEYIDRNKNKAYTGNQVFIAMKTQYETYKKCLEKYKEEKGDSNEKIN